ncbi:MAG TPA: ABC transporter permease [Verrucomicrobiota bacterium]|nr:ABC transporter permease [Verrucomicrobiota bacterium]HNU50430.1 ABC transporter permease [Verrucomicrobiota bacterium]
MTIAGEDAGGAGGGIPWRKVAGEYAGMIAALAGLIVVFALGTDHFFSATNFRTIANQVPAALLVATGMTYVLVLGQIDLSVGSVLGLCGAVMGVALAQGHWPLWAAVLAAVGTGAVCGGFNGYVSVRWRLPTFIVTLGVLEMARGGAHAVTRSQTQYLGSVVEAIAEPHVLGLSLPFLVAVAVVVAAQAVLSRTIFGRYIVAIGTNEEAVRLSGIDPRPVKIAVFVFAGVCVALAAIIDTARFQSANPNAGLGFELQAIAAAVIGGTSLMGGRGSVVSTLFGVLIIAVLNSGLAAVGARDETKRLVTGLVIVAAVIVDHYRHRLTGRKES